MFRFFHVVATLDPWDYLGNLMGGPGVESEVTDKMYLYSGLYHLLRVVGVFGVAITLIFSLIKLMNGSAEQRATLKDVLTAKVLVLLGIFSCAYLFGFILGIIESF